MKRQHPIAIMRYTTKYFLLLLIPLVRGLLPLFSRLLSAEVTFFDFYDWARGAYIDIIVLTAIFGAAYFRWRSVTFEILEDRFVYKGGLFMKMEFSLPYDVISSVTAKRIIWARPAKAVSLYIDSPTRSPLNKKKDSDVYLITGPDAPEFLFEKIQSGNKAVKMNYAASKRELVLYSFVFSSTLSGVVFFAALIIQGGRMLQIRLEDYFLTAVSDVTEMVGGVLSGVTPATVGMSLIIAGGWFVSFMSNLLRHINFKIRRTGAHITIENGFFTKWKYHINANRINYADVRQNLLMKLCRVMSVHVSCAGYGKAKNEIPVFVPITTRKRVLGSMRMLLPRFSPQETQIKPFHIARYVLTPSLLIPSFLAAGLIAVRFFPEWYDIIIFLVIMTEIPSTYLLAVKTAAYHTSGLGFADGTVYLKYCRFFQFHGIIAPLSRIAVFNIRQNIFQRFIKSCDLIVFTNAETTKKHIVKGLRLKEVESYLKELKINC